MKRREERTYPYPPRFIITVNGRLAETDINARFTFEGTEVNESQNKRFFSKPLLTVRHTLDAVKEDTQNSGYIVAAMFSLFYLQSMPQQISCQQQTRVTLTFQKAPPSHQYVNNLALVIIREMCLLLCNLPCKIGRYIIHVTNTGQLSLQSKTVRLLQPLELQQVAHNN